MDAKTSFNTVREALDNIIKSIDGNKDITNILERAGGLLSLIGIALEWYNQYKERIKSEEEKAFFSLFKIVFESAREALERVDKDSGLDESLKTMEIKKQLLKNLLDTFKENLEWNYYLPDHPVVVKFILMIKNELKQKEKNTNEKIKEFGEKFNLYLEEKATEDPDIRKFHKWWTLDKQYKELRDYLESIKLKNIDFKGLDKKPLYEYYLKQNGIMLTFDMWENQYEELEPKHVSNSWPINNLIDDFLADPKRWHIIIAASFGTGKTSLTKMIASEHASNYLSTETIDSQGSGYIPILVFLENDLNNVYAENSLDHVLNKIVSPNPESNKRKILLILDGLDEYKDEHNNDKDIKALYNKCIELHDKFENLKIILTTRIKPGLPEKLSITDKDRKFIKLLPFNEEQVDTFFASYNINITFGKLMDLGLKEEEITKPLLAWMMCQTPEITEELNKIKIKKELSRNMTKSLIYLIFFHYIISGKSVNPKSRADKKKITERYLSEKKLVRIMAILVKIYDDKLTEEIFDKVKSKFNLPQDKTNLYYLALESYFYRNYANNNVEIKFLHTTFKDYLLAEYYIWCLINESNAKYMNIYNSDGQSIGKPSKDTIEFLEGLIELFKTDEPDLKKFVYSSNEIEEICLLNSYEYKEDIHQARKIIRNNASAIVENKKSTVKYMNDQSTDDIIIPNHLYESIWIGRWISLYVLITLGIDSIKSLINTQNLSDLIKLSAVYMPEYIKKLNSIDLSTMDQNNANFYKANLSNADLSNALLYNANFYKANLSNANLSKTNLSYGILFEADLSNANLSKTNLSYGILSGANLSGANLSGANLSGARLLNTKFSSKTILSETDLSNAILNNNEESNKFKYSNNCNIQSISLNGAFFPNADLSNTYISGNLSNAFLNKADLSNTQLWSIDLSYADLSNANLSNAKIIDADLLKTNFIHTNLTKTEFFSVDLNGGILNDANLSYAQLTGVDLSDAYLSCSNLSYAQLTGVDLSNANLSYADVKSTSIKDIKKYDGLICAEADFRDAKIEDSEFLTYLERNGAILT